MNYLSPRDFATKGALAESAPKKVSLYPNLGSRKVANSRTRPGRLSHYNGHDAMITAAQLRAARGLLDWTRADLAKAANISPETVKNIEHGTFRPQEQTAEQIIRAFAAHDVVFTENEGVQVRKESVRTFVGKAGYEEFLDDICLTMKDGGKTRQFNFSDTLISTYGSEKIEKYVSFMQSVTNLDAKCLIPDGDNITPVKHCDYKWLKKTYKDAIPYFLYGNKIAMMSSGPGQEIVFVSISSESLAKAYLQQFDVYWTDAEPIQTSRATR